MKERKLDEFPKLIQDSYSRLSSFPPDSDGYATERNQLLTLLYQYVCVRYTGGEVYTQEAFETGVRCINSFVPDKGYQFFHYFSASFARAKDKADAMELTAQTTAGMHVATEDKKIRTKLFRYLRAHPNIKVHDLYHKAEELAPVLGLSKEDIEEAVLLYDYSFAVRGDAPVDDNENHTVFDTKLSSQPDLTVDIESKDRLSRLFTQIDQRYTEARKGTQGVLSGLLTNLVISELPSNEFLVEVSDYHFFDRRLALEILKRGSPYSQTEIGKKYGKSKANTSQILSRFLATVEEGRG